MPRVGEDMVCDGERVLLRRGGELVLNEPVEVMEALDRDL